VANSHFRGINCSASRTISDSIVQGNQMSQIDGACVQVRVMSNADLAMGAEPKLNPVPANDTCCVDKGLPLSGNFPGFTDYYGAERPAGIANDVGYHELK
jgi:hypothetical protein